MKKYIILQLSISALLMAGCGLTDKFQIASANNSNAGNSTLAAPNKPVEPTDDALSAANDKSPAVTDKNVREIEPSSKQIDSETAYSPVHNVDSKQCKKDKDENLSEGDEFQKVCKGFGGYELVLSGFDYRVKHEIRTSDFSVMLFPLEDAEAGKYTRADLYDQKLGDKIEWRLDEDGKPYAAIVRVMFYKNTGSAKTFSNPKNKVAEFLFVRGLKGYEDLKEDLQTTGTAYNPNEQARMIASKYLEKHRR